jgi:hypothetical protein
MLCNCSIIQQSSNYEQNIDGIQISKPSEDVFAIGIN